MKTSISWSGDTELTLLSRVAWRGQEITSRRLRGLLALLAGDLRTGASTARLVEVLWPAELAHRRFGAVSPRFQPAWC